MDVGILGEYCEVGSSEPAMTSATTYCEVGSAEPAMTSAAAYCKVGSAELAMTCFAYFKVESAKLGLMRTE